MAQLISNYICETADALVDCFGTRDSFELADALDIDLIFSSDFQDLKGMYLFIFDMPRILINNNLPEPQQKTVCAHELGHDRLHRAEAQNHGMVDNGLINMTTKLEREANLFAAQLLLNEAEILELMAEDRDIFEIASIMDTESDLLLIKLQIMNKNGHNFNLPYSPHSDFLAD